MMTSRANQELLSFLIQRTLLLWNLKITNQVLGSLKMGDQGVQSPQPFFMKIEFSLSSGKCCKNMMTSTLSSVFWIMYRPWSCSEAHLQNFDQFLFLNRFLCLSLNEIQLWISFRISFTWFSVFENFRF